MQVITARLEDFEQESAAGVQVKNVVMVEVVGRAVQCVDKGHLCTDQLNYRIWKSPQSRRRNAVQGHHGPQRPVCT
jgi:hypothetical protein